MTSSRPSREGLIEARNRTKRTQRPLTYRQILIHTTSWEGEGRVSRAPRPRGLVGTSPSGIERNV